MDAADPLVVSPWRSQWTIPANVTYLNHGSFGPTPTVVQTARHEWTARLAAQPMDFYLRQMEPALDEAATVLGRFVGADPRDLTFVDNATVAMNVVAATVRLMPGDEVLLNDHEYGAVRRLWQAACDRQHARLVSAAIPTPLSAVDDVTTPLFAAVTPRTKLIVASHVTSPTAIVLPIDEICRRADALGVPVVVDGPHAMAMRDVNLRRMNCAFYCASLHKWLSAPFGSGFLFVRRDWQARVTAPVVSWGRSVGGKPERWQDEFHWLGTRDPAATLAIPSAIRFLEDIGLPAFREHGQQLAREARQQLTQRFGAEALIPDDPQWCGTMVTIPLPPGPIRRPKPNAFDPLQTALWEQYRIEVPVMDWRGRRHLRVSCHLYNDRRDLDRLLSALDDLRSLTA